MLKRECLERTTGNNFYIEATLKRYFKKYSDEFEYKEPFILR